MKASDFCGWLIVTAEANDWHVFDTDLGAGFPTLTLCRGPELMFVHVKAATKKELTPAQAAWQSALKVTGAEAVCWNPTDMQTAYARLTKGSQWNGQGRSEQQSEPVS